MACREEYWLLLNARLDGELSPADEARLSEHLAVCPLCRQDAQDLEVLHAALGDLPVVSAPAGLQARVMAAVDAEAPGPREAAPRAGGRLPWQKWLATAAALALAVGAGALLLPGRDGATAGSAGAASQAAVEMAPEAAPEDVSEDAVGGADLPEEAAQEGAGEAAVNSYGYAAAGADAGGESPSAGEAQDRAADSEAVETFGLSREGADLATAVTATQERTPAASAAPQEAAPTALPSASAKSAQREAGGGGSAPAGSVEPYGGAAPSAAVNGAAGTGNGAVKAALPETAVTAGAESAVVTEAADESLPAPEAEESGQAALDDRAQGDGEAYRAPAISPQQAREMALERLADHGTDVEAVSLTYLGLTQDGGAYLFAVEGPDGGLSHCMVALDGSEARLAP